MPKRVLLVGWDAADWQMIHPLIEQGLMPTTAKFMAEGAWGNLATTRPILSPMLWNTIATGKRPQQHGVLGFTEVNPEGDGVQPASSTSRQCKALWNILTQSGLRSNIIGWYASHPAESIAGVMVSNQFEQYREVEGGISEPPADCIYPPEFAASLAELRVLRSEIDATAILPFVPDAQRLLEEQGNRIGKLQHMLAQTATIQAVATQLITQTDWDFTAIYFEGIDRFGHEFMEFHPPKMEQVSQRDYEAYQHCMNGIYRFHDMILDTLMQLAGDDTAVILMSDHGYYNDHLRPDPRPGKSGPVEWHRPFGILAAHGKGVQPGTRLYGASIMDIAPTVLQLLGLPAAYDMPGRILAEVLQDSALINRIESWEEIEGVTGMHPAAKRVEPAESRAMLEQLVALGYVDPLDKDIEKTIRDTISCNQFNLIQSLIDTRQFSEALEAFNMLDESFRSQPAAQLLLASCHMGTGDFPAARKLLVAMLASGCQQPRLYVMLGTLEFSKGNTQIALEHFDHVAQAEPNLPGLQNKLGNVYLETKRYEPAIEAFEQALSVDSDSPIAYAGIARGKLKLGYPQAALDHALIAAELVHHFPRVHLVIGEALLALEDYQGAIEALELCIKQAPKFRKAHEHLATAYNYLGRTEQARRADMRARGILS